MMNKDDEKRQCYQKLIKKSKAEQLGKEAPSCCGRCLYHRPEFQYRSCLFTKCHYRKDRKIFRNRKERNGRK